MSYTHTYVRLDISQQAYNEIKAKLELVGYQHVFLDDSEAIGGVVIDMHGIALAPQTPPIPASSATIAVLFTCNLQPLAGPLHLAADVVGTYVPGYKLFLQDKHWVVQNTFPHPGSLEVCVLPL